MGWAWSQPLFGVCGAKEGVGTEVRLELDPIWGLWEWRGGGQWGEFGPSPYLGSVGLAAVGRCFDPLGSIGVRVAGVRVQAAGSPLGSMGQEKKVDVANGLRGAMPHKHRPHALSPAPPPHRPPARWPRR